MTATALPDLDAALAGLDFDHETPCQISNCRGGDGAPARWRLVLACGCVLLICQPCKDQHDQDAADDPKPTGSASYRCSTCGAFLGGSYRNCFVSLEPLP